MTYRMEKKKHTNGEDRQRRAAKLSLVIPVFNRPQEVEELLQSMCRQTVTDFEVVIVEDGSTITCQAIVQTYSERLTISYHFIPNGGPGQARNYGATQANGDYLLVLDSDCILPEGYIQAVCQEIERTDADAFGGPDRASEHFSPVQKAINYSMTSFCTTGGIRGGKINMEKFVPRTFNMGFSREVYSSVGGFKDMFGEDIDLSMRIREAGFSTKLYREAFVYHKRRVSLKKFYRQVNIFGVARINLYKLYPQSLKLVHALPAVFVLGSLLLLILAAVYSPYFLLPFVFYILLLFFDSLIRNKSTGVALLSIIACYIQLVGYGTGFIKSFIEKIILRKGLEDIETLKRIYK